jgi:hypothetical protein
MKCAWLAGPSLTLLLGVTAAVGAGDPRLESLALCGDSWLDWKNTAPARLDSFGAFARSAFTHKDNDAFVTPKSAMTIVGLKVRQVFPESVGMGVGFSVIVDATFDESRRALEQKLGKTLGQCETSDGMRACELPIAEQRTVTLMSSDSPGDKTTLVGCYYFYEK